MCLKRNGREEYKESFCKHNQVDTRARSGKALEPTVLDIFEKREMTSSVERSLFQWNSSKRNDTVEAFCVVLFIFSLDGQSADSTISFY